MTTISIYDDSYKLIEKICDKLDVSEAEVIDYLLDNMTDEAAEETKIWED